MDDRTRFSSSADKGGEPCGIDAPTPKAPEGFEDTEGLAIAEEAEEEYKLRGIEGTIPYTQYRDRRLGSES